MDHITLHLTRPEWQSTEDTSLHMRGTVFLDNTRVPFCDISGYLPENTNDPQAWQKSLLGFNGFFALIHQTPSHMVAAVDRVRSIPLFYGQDNGHFYLSDDAELVRQEVGDNEMDPVASEEFQLAGYVTGADTLFPKVKQLQAGECLHITEKNQELHIQAQRYYRFLHEESTQWDEAALANTMDSVVESAIRRLAAYANGRQIVIPLSGGYDSRLIALMLKRIGYDNILTFTYGVPGNKESEYSRLVAEALKLPWHFVEYNAEKWRSAWQTDERKHYQRWGSGWASLPHVQDWLAIRELKGAGLLKNDSVLVPGHGVMAILTHLKRYSGNSNVSASLEYLLKSKFNLSPSHSGLSNTISSKVGSQLFEEALDGYDRIGAFVWQEYQSKFLANSVRVYDYYGYDWWMPLWDSEFMKFWEQAPLSIRKNKNWYVGQVRNTYQNATQSREPMGNAAQSSKMLPVLRFAKNFAPSSLLKIARRYIRRSAANHPLASPGRFPPDELKKLQTSGYLSNGIPAYFFLKEASTSLKQCAHQGRNG